MQNSTQIGKNDKANETLQLYSGSAVDLRRHNSRAARPTWDGARRCQMDGASGRGQSQRIQSRQRIDQGCAAETAGQTENRNEDRWSAHPQEASFLDRLWKRLSSRSTGERCLGVEWRRRIAKNRGRTICRSDSPELQWANQKTAARPVRSLCGEQ